MAEVVLIACVKSKRSVRSRAASLYTSTLFKLTLAYARSLEPDQIFILSAKHGLLRLDEEIDPYEQTLKTMGVGQRRAWAKHVIDQLRRYIGLDEDRVIFLAGQAYREFLEPEIARSEVPMEGLAFGQQLQWLKARVDER